MRKRTASAIALGTFIAGLLLGFGGSHMIYKAKLMAYEMIDIEYMATYVRFSSTKVLLRHTKPPCAIIWRRLTSANAPAGALFHGPSLWIER